MLRSVVCAVLVLGLAGGAALAEGGRPGARPKPRGPVAGKPGGDARKNAGKHISGTITAIDDTSVSVKLGKGDDARTVQLTLGAGAKVDKLKVGDTVTVTTSPDGKTAVQITGPGAKGGDKK